MSSHKPRRIVMVDNTGESEAPEGHVTFAHYVENQSEAEPELNRPTHIYDEVTRLYTSGTTGSPKDIPLNNINAIFSAHDLAMHFPLSPIDKTMNMSPWFHRGGIHSDGPCPTLYVGGEVIILHNFSPRLYLEYVEEYGITFLVWIYIGDMGTWDKNEFITIAGRKNDMIVSSGENIHPVQVEEILNLHPMVEESLVVGVPDDLRGESVVA